MKAMLHQLFHLFASRWFYDTWQAGIFTCESRVCATCYRSQFRSENGLTGRRTGWTETTEQPMQRGRDARAV